MLQKINYDLAKEQIYTAYKVIEHFNLYRYSFAIGGSTSMFMQGVPLNRKIHDLDIVLPLKSRSEVITGLNDNPFVKVVRGSSSNGSIGLKMANREYTIDLLFLDDASFQKSITPVTCGDIPRVYCTSLEFIKNIKRKWNRHGKQGAKDEEDIFAITLTQVLMG